MRDARRGNGAGIGGWRCLLAALLLAGCSAAGNSSPVALSREARLAAAAGDLVFLGGVSLQLDDAGFGGLSDLRVDPDGSRFVAVSDRGAIVTGGLSYGADGRLAAAAGLSVRPLADVDGRPVAGIRRDAEGLDRLPDGSWLVSFERDHRLMRYAPGLDGLGRAPQPYAAPAAAGALPENEGLEALAVLPDGRVATFAEAEQAPGRHQGWVGRAGDWRPVLYRTVAPFVPTSAAALPDGGMVVLERRFSLLGGFASRLVRIPAGQLLQPDGRQGPEVLEGVELGRLEPPRLTENFEGVAVRIAADGAVLLYLVSDDNFMALQRTLLLLFRCPSCGRFPAQAGSP
jgi:hypothetical protein